MIHEIRPGDVVIVNLAEPPVGHPLKVEEIKDKLNMLAGVSGMIIIAGTETSVHVLRKAEEAKGEAKADNWPVWVSVSDKTPNVGQRVIMADAGGIFAGAWDSGYKRVTHWMPQPELPK